MTFITLNKTQYLEEKSKSIPCSGTAKKKVNQRTYIHNIYNDFIPYDWIRSYAPQNFEMKML